MIEFVVALPPRPKLRARHVLRFKGSGKFRQPYIAVITPDQTIIDEQSFLRLATKHAPRKPLSGPLELSLLFVMPIMPSWSARERADAAAGVAFPTGKPDVDNMVKLVKDALNEVFWHDDAQVCVVHARKVYGQSPRTEVRIVEIAGPAEAMRLF